jgi:hypothetical protein
MLGQGIIRPRMGPPPRIVRLFYDSFSIFCQQVQDSPGFVEVGAEHRKLTFEVTRNGRTLVLAIRTSHMIMIRKRF